MKKSLLLPMVVSSLLYGCGGTGQDEPGLSSASTVTFSGQAIDGFIARALVYIDSNENYQLDSWEPRAFTDDQGYFSYNPVTDTNYCASDATAIQKQFCLRSNLQMQSAMIHIVGGYDVLLGEPFTGRMSNRVSIGESTTVNDVLVTPLTSIVSRAKTAEDRTDLLSALGLTEDDLTVNYLDGDSTTDQKEVNSALFAKAVKIHKVATVLAEALEQHYGDLGEEDTLPRDAFGMVYEALMENLLVSGGSVDTMLQDNAELLNVFDQAQTAIREFYEANEDLYVPEMLGLSDSLATSAIVDAGSLVDLADAILTGNPVQYEEAMGQARAVEIVTRKIIEELNDGYVDPSIANAVAEFIGTDSATLLSILQEPFVDLDQLVGNDFTDATTALSDAVLTGNGLTGVSGSMLRIEDNDNNDPNGINGIVELYFSGGSGESFGELSACVRYQDLENGQVVQGEDNTQGTHVTGSWSQLDNRMVLLVLEFDGAEFQSILKLVGNNTFQFDYGGEIAEWDTQYGLSSQPVELPTSNDGCITRFDG